MHVLVTGATGGIGLGICEVLASQEAGLTLSVASSQAGPKLDALLQSLGAAKLCLQAGDIAGKGKAIVRGVRLIEEGLKAGLNVEQGGELATNLRGLYDYCVVVLTEANLRNDVAKIDEVTRLIQPIAQAWNEIKSQVSGASQRTM